jgi:hypothetical protein
MRKKTTRMIISGISDLVLSSDVMEGMHKARTSRLMKTCHHRSRQYPIVRLLFVSV